MTYCININIWIRFIFIVIAKSTERTKCSLASTHKCKKQENAYSI